MITPATLSGAVDVIVVARTDEDGNVELACSPFHVRFGKLSVWAPVDRKVRVKVNGELSPFSMKVTETGEAFFVFETDEKDVPADLITSPLAQAISDSDVASGNVPSELQGMVTSARLPLSLRLTCAGTRALGSERRIWHEDAADFVRRLCGRQGAFTERR